MPLNQTLTESPLFKSLKAAQARRVFTLPWCFPRCYKTATAPLDGPEGVLKKTA